MGLAQWPFQKQKNDWRSWYARLWLCVCHSFVVRFRICQMHTDFFSRSARIKRFTLLREITIVSVTNTSSFFRMLFYALCIVVVVADFLEFYFFFFLPISIDAKCVPFLTKYYTKLNIFNLFTMDSITLAWFLCKKQYYDLYAYYLNNFLSISCFALAIFISLVRCDVLSIAHTKENQWIWMCIGLNIEMCLPVSWTKCIERNVVVLAVRLQSSKNT